LKLSTDFIADVSTKGLQRSAQHDDLIMIKKEMSRLRFASLDMTTHFAILGDEVGGKAANLIPI